MIMGAPYCYDDVKLICPFCKSEMEFDTILIDQDHGWPYYIDYVCANGKCHFELRLKWEDFEKRIDCIKHGKEAAKNKGGKSDAKN